MNTKQALNLNPRTISKMSEKELRKVISTLRSTARKRYERLSQQGFYNLPMKTFSKNSPNKKQVLPTVKGMDKITLRNEYKRYARFLNAKTSTIEGAKKSERQSKEFIESISGRNDFTDSEMNEIFSMADRLNLTDEISHIMSSSDKVTAVIEEYHPNRSREEILEKARERVQERYELQQAESIPPSHFYKENTD